jgi:autotransporter-associated beta strand protein
MRAAQRWAASIAALIFLSAAIAAPARAQDATWLTNPGSGDFGTASNWSPATVPTGTAFFNTSSNPNLTMANSVTLGGWTFNAGASNYTFDLNNLITTQLTFTGAGIAVNGGSVTINNVDAVIFRNTSTAGSATIMNTEGSVIFHDASTAGQSTINNSSVTAFEDGSTAGNATINSGSTGEINFLNTSTAGNAIITNNFSVTFQDSSTAGSATIINNARILFENSSTGGNAAIVNNAPGALVDFSTSSGPASNQVSAGSIAGGGKFYLGSDTLTVGSNNTSTTVSGVISDCGSDGTMCFAAGGNNGALVKVGTGTLTLSGINTYDGGTTVNAGLINFNSASSFGTGSITLNGGGLQWATGTSTDISSRLAAIGSNGAIFDTNGNNVSLATGLSGTGGLTKIGAGTLVLSATSLYSGVTNVTGGTLEVDGSIASSSSVNVASGAKLTGIGVVDPLPATTTIMSGGIFAPGTANAPGTSMTIGGNLALQSGALYVIYLNPSTSSFAHVTSAATLGGATVSAMFANGSYVAKQYTILDAASVNGAFSSVVNTNLPSGFRTSLSYDATHAYLDLALSFVPPPGGPGSGGNQQGVANAIINFFNTNGSIPLVFGSLTPQGLTQISGETTTGSQQTTFNAMGQFMGMMTDPFMGRGGGINGSSSAIGYAEEGGGVSSYAARSNPSDAFAMFTKEPLAKVYDPRWSVWASGFGGSQSTSGSGAAGTNTATNSIFGTAVGADYLFSPNTIAGFAMAGGGTSFSVANGGSGRSDLFQAGAYLRHNQGPAYLSAALAYGWQDITTNRTVTVAGFDQLRAQFNANAWSGRLEGGYRFVSSATFGVGITPYAAAQFATFDLPAYAEQAIVGTNNFALNYGAHDATDARTELGIRADKSWLTTDGILTLRGRLAWAHDYDPDRSIAATFQTLPGASFVVNGAAQAADSALTTAAVEMKWRSGWSVAATFEGEFSSVTNSYAGKGVVRYAW